MISTPSPRLREKKRMLVGPKVSGDGEMGRTSRGTNWVSGEWSDRKGGMNREIGLAKKQGRVTELGGARRGHA